MTRPAASAAVAQARGRGHAAGVDEALDAGRVYLQRLAAAMPAAAKTLRRHGRISRGGAADALAAAGALLPAALARHLRKRAAEPSAALEVLARHGRPAALADPRALLAERLADPETSPRLGGLLGDDGPRAAAWLATRSGDAAEPLGRALAAAAPLVLGALMDAAPAETLLAWLTRQDEVPLAEPERLAGGAGGAAAAFRVLRRRAFPVVDTRTPLMPGRGARASPW